MESPSVVHYSTGYRYKPGMVNEGISMIDWKIADRGNKNWNKDL